MNVYKKQIITPTDQGKQRIIGDKTLLIKELQNTFEKLFNIKNPKEELATLIRFLETNLSNANLNSLNATLVAGKINKQQITAEDIKGAEEYCQQIQKGNPKNLIANNLVQFILSNTLGEPKSNIKIKQDLPFSNKLPNKLSAVVATKEASQGTFQGNIKIGKTPDNKLQIKDPYVSKEHCQILFVDGEIAGIADLNSSNGTYVNGNKIEEFVELKNNDVIQIGTTKIKVINGNRLVVTIKNKENPIAYDIDKNTGELSS